MTTSDVVIGAVVDRSGSMGGAVDGVIAGFNEFRREQALQEGNAWLTLSLFDNIIERPYVAWNCRDIPDIGHETYFVRGSTALYDAFVSQIEQMDAWLRQNAWFNGKKVVLVITDGYENASTRYPAVNRRQAGQWNTWGGVGVGVDFVGAGNWQVAQIAQQKKEQGWEFVVFGANVDAKSIARQLGIEADRAHQFTADARDSRQVFGAYSVATSALRGGDVLAYSATLDSVRAAQSTGGEWNTSSKADTSK